MVKALFLDRDGVINVDKNYVYKIEDFEFKDDIFDICLKYQSQGFLIFVVTNQAGIARGYYSENDFWILTDWMCNKFQEKGINIKKVYFCPHHPEFTGECLCRKPNPGMLLKAIEEYDIDISSSVMIGDKQTDIDAAKNAGIKNTILVS